MAGNGTIRRKSTPVAAISASTRGSIRLGSGGGATATSSAGRPSHWAVEDSEPLQERDGLRVLAGLAGASLFVLGREAVGIDDGGAVLALADIAAEAAGGLCPALNPSVRQGAAL